MLKFHLNKHLTPGTLVLDQVHIFLLSIFEAVPSERSLTANLTKISFWQELVVISVADTTHKIRSQFTLFVI